MTFRRYLFAFTRTEPWASLGLLRRIARICRILFGCLLMGSLLLPAGFALHEISANSRGTPTLPFVILVPFLLSLVLAVGCMFIWRGVHPPPKPASNDLPPPAPPTEGAPRPAPLRPFSPLVLSAYTELPDPRNA